MSRRRRYSSNRACRATRMRFLMAVDELNLTVGGWSIAIRKAAALSTVNREIQYCFLRVWTESKMLLLRAGKRRALVEAVRVLLPRSRCPGPVHLFRGAPPASIGNAHMVFAGRQIARPRRGLLTSERSGTVEAWCSRRSRRRRLCFMFGKIDGDYEEREYIVDPYLLSQVKVIARYSEAAGDQEGLGRHDQKLPGVKRKTICEAPGDRQGVEGASPLR